jgi:hypothetical protein
MFRSIALGGGGVRGGLHVGGLSAIEKIRGNLEFPEGIYGSSIGAVIATAVAFNLNASQIRTMFDEHFHMSKAIPSLSLSSIHSLGYKKGLFPMDSFEQSLIDIFMSQGIDLRNKTVSDSPQKLYIVASNMTTCKPTLLTGDVPLLKSILCSCCLPFVFQPQVLYNNLYLDGGICLHSLDDIVPKDCLVLHIRRSAKPVHVSNFEETSLLDFLGHIYEVSRKTPLGNNTIWFQNDDVSILQELTPDIKQRLFDQGRSQAFAFFAKRASEETEKGIHGSSANVVV